jgi:hypothetical protein
MALSQHGALGQPSALVRLAEWTSLPGCGPLLLEAPLRPLTALGGLHHAATLLLEATEEQWLTPAGQTAATVTGVTAQGVVPALSDGYLSTPATFHPQPPSPSLYDMQASA